MKNYICKYGLYHDKPCVNFEPKSNNGWIYTAMAKYRIDYKMPHPRRVFDLCKPDNLFIANRLPDKPEPPISRDEIIGMRVLSVLSDNDLEQYGYRFFKTLAKFSLMAQLKAVWSLRGKHRNHVWEYKVYAAYPIVFKLAPHDVYWTRKLDRKSVSLFHTIMFYMYMLQVLCKNNAGHHNLLWLQLKALDSKVWVKFLNIDKSMLEYFGKDHDFNK